MRIDQKRKFMERIDECVELRTIGTSLSPSKKIDYILNLGKNIFMN